MNTRILYIFTRTPLHVGAGSSVGAIDQPVQRERHTGYPIIPGSGIKGVMRDHFVTTPKFSDQGVKALFGHSDGDNSAAGLLAFSEAKLLLFPLRSAKGSYAMATSALALNRYRRDAGIDLPEPPQIDDGSCCAGGKLVISQNDRQGIVLEEYRFNVTDPFPQPWADHLSGLLGDAVLQGAKDRFVLLSDGDFAHFALNATQVNQHVRIDDESGTAHHGGLFNEETVPSETLFHSVLTELPRASNGEHETIIKDAVAVIGDERLIQFGGNGTTGSGYCTIGIA